MIDRTTPDAPVPLAPLVSPDGEFTPELERRLAPLALAARAGNRDARDALWWALAPKIDRLVAAAGRPTRRGDGPRRDGRAWDGEDLAQEAFPLFADLLAGWPGDGPIGPYLLSHLAWRLRSAAHALVLPRRRELPFLPPHLLYFADESAAAAEALTLLDALAADLPPPDGAILLGHVRDGASLAVVARRLGLGRRTVNRRWRAIKDGLRREG